MRRPAVLVLTAMFLLLIPTIDTEAGTYQSVTGYQVNYPDGWLLATESDQKSVEEAARQFGTKMDFSTLDVMLYDPRSSPIANVNVAVLPEAIKADQDSLSTVQDGIRQQLAAVGTKPDNLEGQITRFGKYEAISATWTADYGSKVLHQWQVVFPGAAEAYIFTCSASTSNFTDEQPSFAQILNSFSIPLETASGGLSAPLSPAESSTGMSPVLRYLVIFGILAILAVVVGVRLIRAKPAPAKPTQAKPTTAKGPSSKKSRKR